MRPTYRIEVNMTGLTVRRLFTKRSIPWNEIQLIYDLTAQPYFDQLVFGGFLQPYFGLFDLVLRDSFSFRHIYHCYELASAKTRIILPIIATSATSRFGSSPIFNPAQMEYDTAYFSHMESIIALAVQMSGVPLRTASTI